MKASVCIGVFNHSVAVFVNFACHVCVFFTRHFEIIVINKIVACIVRWVNICLLYTSQSADGKRRWRLDWDETNGSHINVEDFSKGKKSKAIKIAIPFEGNKKEMCIRDSLQATNILSVFDLF